MRDHASSALNGHNNMRHTRRYTADPVEQLLSGARNEVVVSHGRSQYSTSGGASSCGLAALNCARIVLSKETGGLKVESLVRSILLPDTFEVSVMVDCAWYHAYICTRKSSVHVRRGRILLISM